MNEYAEVQVGSLIEMRKSGEPVFAVRQEGREVVLTLYAGAVPVEHRLTLLGYCQLATTMVKAIAYLEEPTM